MKSKTVIGVGMFNLTYKDLIEIIKSLVANPSNVRYPLIANSVSYEDESMNLYIETSAHRDEKIPTQDGRAYSLEVAYFCEIIEAEKWINQLIDLLNNKGAIYGIEYGVGNEVGDVIGEEIEILHPKFKELREEARKRHESGQNEV